MPIRFSSRASWCAIRSRTPGVLLVNFQHVGKPVIDLTDVRLIYLGDDSRTPLR